MYCQILGCTVTYLDDYMLNTCMIHNSHTIFIFILQICLLNLGCSDENFRASHTRTRDLYRFPNTPYVLNPIKRIYIIMCSTELQ